MIVVTTVLMLPAFSFSTASFPVIVPTASVTCAIVVSIRVRPVRPSSAICAVCSAVRATSPIVFTSSFDVAVISVEVAPISVVVAAISDAVACCCFAVAAISVDDVFTWMPDFCTCPTNAARLRAISARALPMTSRSERGLNSTVRSPAAMRFAAVLNSRSVATNVVNERVS